MLYRVIYEPIKAMNTQSYAKHSQNLGWDFQILHIEQLPRWHLRLTSKSAQVPPAACEAVHLLGHSLPQKKTLHDCNQVRNTGQFSLTLYPAVQTTTSVWLAQVPWTSELYLFLLGGELSGLKSHRASVRGLWRWGAGSDNTLCICVERHVFLLVLNTTFSFSMRKKNQGWGQQPSCGNEITSS